MIVFTIGVDSVTWDVSENTLEWSEEDTKRMDKYADEIAVFINQILGIEHILNSESVQLKLAGDGEIDIDFFVFKENIKEDLSTMKFYETIISRKTRILKNFKQVLIKLDKDSAILHWSDEIVTILNRVWLVGADCQLHSYIAAEEL